MAMLLISNYANGKPLVLKHYQSHSRYEYGLVLLKKTLANNNITIKYQAFEKKVNEARGEILLKKGRVDFQFLSTTPEREAEMRAIKVPIYYGLLGCRLLLTSRGNVNKFAKVTDIADLRKFVGGHGTHWGDLPIYSHNKLPVHITPKYETLFKMLAGGRFDYFHRGISEIWPELDRWQAELVIANKIAIFYKHPVYFFVRKDNKALGDLIEESFRKALNQEDNIFKSTFLHYHGDMIKKAELSQRNLIILEKPYLPKNSPPIDTSPWMIKAHQEVIRKKNL
jgi:hypothetical protein